MGTTPTSPPLPPGVAESAARVADADPNVAAWEELGAEINRNEQGEVVRVSLSFNTEITDAGMVHLKGQTALERLAQYILGCPFSLARVVRLTDGGSVIYRAVQDHCPRFPTPANADLRGGPCRNFQVFSALDLLTELTQHVPEQGEHLVRYYGWYSHRQRGIRAKLRRIPEPELELVPIDRSVLHAERSASGRPPAGSLSTWAMLIKLVYEVDPLACPRCGSTLKIINFIKPRQWDVIEWILRHCGLWEGAIRTLANARGH